MKESDIFSPRYEPESSHPDYTYFNDMPDGRTRVIYAQEAHARDWRNEYDIMTIKILDLAKRRVVLDSGGVYASLRGEWKDGALHIRAMSGALDRRPDLNFAIDLADDVFRAGGGEAWPLEELPALVENSFGRWADFWDKGGPQAAPDRSAPWYWLIVALIIAGALGAVWWWFG